MEKYFFEQQPKEAELTHFVGGAALLFHFGTVETEGGYESYELCVGFNDPSQVSYDNIVSNIVRQKYSSDAVEAILNNYLNDPEAGREEFEDLQDWRAQAKAWAKEGLKLIEEERK